MELTGDKALIKTGAEGAYCAAFPELGLGAAIKVDDGAGRAAEVLMARLLARFGILSDDQATALGGLFTTPVLNRAGHRVGEIRPAARLPFSIGGSMKAVLCRAWGGPESLAGDAVPAPAPAPDQVLVSVAAAGVHFADSL